MSEKLKLELLGALKRRLDETPQDASLKELIEEVAANEYSSKAMETLLENQIRLEEMFKSED